MPRMIEFFVPGKPQGKGRPRSTRIGNHHYTPAKTREYENLIRECCYAQCPTAKAGYTGWVQAVINCQFPIPKSASKRKKIAMQGGEIRPLKKPDLDNIAKVILDALNQVAYDDDKQVASLVMTKEYTQHEEDVGVRVTIYYF